jgi:diaminopropionate ammonia-lyase
MNRFFLNPNARAGQAPTGLFDADEYRQVSSFRVQSTALHHLQGLANRISVADVMVKDESSRLGMNAFKILGVSYAVDRLLGENRISKGSVLVCATTGNHGRAVARSAREHGLAATVYVPAGAATARIKAIEEEGATVVVVDGNYDDAVRLATADATRHGWTIISDTAWPGYEEIPRLIMAGYTKLMEEAEGQWAPEPPPDMVLVQAGVGGLTGAVLSWLCHRFGAKRPFTIVCEPTSAACYLESARAGKPVSLRGPFNTSMAGLASGEVSSIAWPSIAAAADAFVAIDDEPSFQTMLGLAHPIDGDPVIVAGASGACGLATLLEVLRDEELRAVREASGLNTLSRVLVINTEGATDPELYDRVTAASEFENDIGRKETDDQKNSPD